MPLASADPLILTLEMDNVAQERFNVLRQAHFPKERNLLDAHLTLFHRLPAHEHQITEDLALYSASTARLQMDVVGLLSLGAGVAFRIENKTLSGLHKTLQQRWQPWLSAQDRQKRHFHVSIQNKTSAETAALLLRDLRETFSPFHFAGTGFNLWAYKNGPWEWRARFPFTT